MSLRRSGPRPIRGRPDLQDQSRETSLAEIKGGSQEAAGTYLKGTLNYTGGRGGLQRLHPLQIVIDFDAVLDRLNKNFFKLRV